MRFVRLGQLGLVERDRPGDRQRLIGQVDEGVGVLRYRVPVIIDQVGVRGLFRQRLETVPDPPGDKDRGLRAHLNGEATTEPIAWPQVDPRAEDPPGRE